MPRARALVTGASVGIGRAFAEELARRGHDLVLVARNAEQLQALSSELASRHAGLEAEVLPADLTAAAGVRAVVERLEDGSFVDVLVNNAGRGAHGPFAELSRENQLGEVDLNVRALVELSHAGLSRMLERRAGGLLNVASIAGFQPVPNEAVYAATKAFVVCFTESLHEEVRGSGVKVSVLCPGFTRTEFQERAGIAGRSLPGFLWQQAGVVAATGLDALEAGRAVCVPGVHNKLLAGLVRSSPRAAVRWGSGVALRQFG